jgi:hypothetical protein
VLFEVDHHVSFGVHTYGGEQQPSFLQATSLYHPDTVERSLKHDGSGVEPGLKDPDGSWDLRPHASRIQNVDLATLGTWHAVLEAEDVPVDQSRMVYTVNQSTAVVLNKLSAAPRIGDLGLSFSPGWHEKNDRTKGFFDSEWGVPESWDQVILQGPHLHVANPFYKSPNQTMLHNQDWTAVDLEALLPDAIPTTSYKPRGDRAKYDAAYGKWSRGHDLESARAGYRIAWRTMAANTGERTLIPALIPPGAAHIHRVSSIGSPNVDARVLSTALGFLSSLLCDFLVRAVPKSDILMSTIERLPLDVGCATLGELIALRTARLNCVTRAYAPFWEAVTGRDWTPAVPYRLSSHRRAALIEIDALVALALEISVEDLVAIYRTQFPVLHGYDRSSYVYDVNGRLVPTSVLSTWKGRGGNGGTFTDNDLTAIHRGSGAAYRYALPFVLPDREQDIRIAYAEFERRVASRDSKAK